jgi:starch synthase (maltosyl-transferring)
MPRKPEKLLVYNLFPLLIGPVTDWDPHLRRAAGMGFNWLFLNPIQWPGSSGSLYSVKDYFRINPRLVDPAAAREPAGQIRDALEKASTVGLRTMVDLVINHCAVDSPLPEEHPAWFRRDSEGRLVHPSANQDGKQVVWRDLAAFNYEGTPDKEGLYSFVAEVVDFLLGLGVSGFRCDAAYQVPAGLWRPLIRETKSKHPEVLFVAETLGCTPDETRRTAEAGFDYIFNSVKWWNLKSSWLLAQYNLTRESAPSIGFPESHDTARLAEELGGNVDGLKQRYLLAALFSTGVMIPAGFEFGFRKRLDVVNTRPSDWEETGVDLTAFVREVNEIKARHAVFQEEAPTEILPSPPETLLMWKGSLTCSEEALIVLNKDCRNRQRFHVPELYEFVQGRTGLVDVSPEERLDYISDSFSYELRPGQGIVLITSRETRARME